MNVRTISLRFPYTLLTNFKALLLGGGGGGGGVKTAVEVTVNSNEENS